MKELKHTEGAGTFRSLSANVAKQKGGGNEKEKKDKMTDTTRFSFVLERGQQP
jgi:hypothetical protein